MAEPIDTAHRRPRYWTGLSWGSDQLHLGVPVGQYSPPPIQLSPKPGGATQLKTLVERRHELLGARLTWL